MRVALSLLALLFVDGSVLAESPLPTLAPIVAPALEAVVSLRSLPVDVPDLPANMPGLIVAHQHESCQPDKKRRVRKMIMSCPPKKLKRTLVREL